MKKRFTCVLVILHFMLVFTTVKSSSIILASHKTNTQPVFNSERLRQIFRMLPDACKADVRNKYSSIPSSYYFEAYLNNNKRTLVFRINEFKEIDHIGLFLINDTLDKNPVREVFDYLEREFLVSELLKEEYPLVFETNNKKTEVLVNGISLKDKKNTQSVPEINISKDNPFRITYNPDMFSAEWILASRDTFEIKIPNKYSLITDKTKDELENNLLRKLKYPFKGKIVDFRPTAGQLKPYWSNIYIFEDDIYPDVPEISSSKFFMISDSIYPVFSRSYYLESVSNLFLNMIPTQTIMHLTQKLYGGNQEELTININSFLSIFDTDYIIYFGWQNIDRDNLRASIIISNTIYNFNHLLELSTDYRAVFGNKGEIKAMFYSFIPREIIRKNFVLINTR